MTPAGAAAAISGAKILAILGDSVTTDHISPAGSIKPTSPAGIYLQEHDVAVADFNSYGARRGNHEVMMRGTFANVRIKNLMLPGTEGGITKLPERDSCRSTTRRCATSPKARRRWSSAARSTAPARRATGRRKARMLLGVKAVIARSFERIHRSNLVGMGVLPLQFIGGDSAQSLGRDH